MISEESLIVWLDLWLPVTNQGLLNFDRSRNTTVGKHTVWCTGGPFKQFKAMSFKFDFQPSLSTLSITDQNCFLFWQMIPKIHDKDDKILYFAVYTLTL